MVEEAAAGKEVTEQQMLTKLMAEVVADEVAVAEVGVAEEEGAQEEGVEGRVAKAVNEVLGEDAARPLPPLYACQPFPPHPPPSPMVRHCLPRHSSRHLCVDGIV